MRDADAVPEPILNNHCPACQFQQRCRARAAAIDHLSLLRGMGEKEIAKLGRRGIFTITQLSYTYRPRRTGKDQRPIRGHSFALQALAIREKKIYVLGNPELPDSPVRIYFDIEGSAERGTAYLIGMIVEDGGSERRFSFWADGDGQEERILGSFLDVVEGYPDGRLFCYGSFEVAFLKRMRKSRVDGADRLGSWPGRRTSCRSSTRPSTSRSTPTGSSRSAPIWASAGREPDASGLQCIVWRKRWETVPRRGPEAHDRDL